MRRFLQDFLFYIYLGEEVREQMEYERDWLSTLMRSYIDLVYKIPAEGEGKFDRLEILTVFNHIVFHS
jgi:hypothetical protein